MCVRHAQRQRDREEYREREIGRKGGEREKLLRVVAFCHMVPGLNSDH